MESDTQKTLKLKIVSSFSHTQVFQFGSQTCPGNDRLGHFGNELDENISCVLRLLKPMHVTSMTAMIFK